MPQKIVAGNWKMNTCPESGVQLVKQVLKGKLPEDVRVIVFPPFTHLSEIGKVIFDTNIDFGAQNCANYEQGAYTGEVSAEMIKATGANYILVGHSERRGFYGETNSILKDKVDIILKHKLKPIYCCGETLSERERKQHFNIVEQQITDGLFHLKPEAFQQVVIAYEPVWAIGTGVTASPDQAQEMHAFIRQVINRKYDESLARETAILYGGSCKPSNAADLFSKEDVNGGLIGGASLNADDFIQIINAF